eukprot:CAMPEP_0119298968 /NCGR_PEP_ID=MMETSP1333-20130426/1095_1 /TAXON_ID=418940 /ORGANISM="Scyphosphaera apsteinii, Strain RCC1455" /LENGTH=169 /DNA_ID=CAMNT_0007300227 /DNA_START=7 /DNA_END=512 /DNA_ORIENTATION=+
MARFARVLGTYSLDTNAGGPEVDTCAQVEASRWALAEVLHNKRCSQELWQVQGMDRLDAEARCDADDECKGLHFFNKNGGNGRSASSGWYQGCGGELATVNNAALGHHREAGDSGGDDGWYWGYIQSVESATRATIQYDDGDTWTGHGQYIYTSVPVSPVTLYQHMDFT